MDLRVSEHNAGPGRVLNSKASFAVLPRHAADGSTQVITVQQFNVFDLTGQEGLG